MKTLCLPITEERGRRMGERHENRQRERERESALENFVAISSKQEPKPFPDEAYAPARRGARMRSFNRYKAPLPLPPPPAQAEL